MTPTAALEDNVSAPGATSTIDLSANFDDPTKATDVRITTPLGNIDVQLLDDQKPITVQNFLSYVRSGAYDTTFIHRVTQEATDGLGVVQGGGYDDTSFGHITTDAPIVNEFDANGVVSNTRGTIAMAKTSDPDSATSEWFINVTDNSTSLDDTSNSGGFTVFGNVTADTLATVDAIAAVPTIAANDPFSQIPLRDYTDTDLQSGVTPTTDNLITTTAQVVPELTYTVTSSDPSVVGATISGTKLVLAYGQGTGQATITVTASDSDGNSVTRTFTAESALQVSIGSGGSKSVTYTDADGTTSTISLKGKGAAVVSFGGSGLAEAGAKQKASVTGTAVAVAVAGISMTGTDKSTALTIASRGGDGGTVIGGITTDGAVASISAKTDTLDGDLTTGGALGSLVLAAARNAKITIGSSQTDRASSLSLGAATDVTISSGPAIKSLKTGTFVDTDQSNDTLTAPSIGSLVAAGNVDESISLTGALKTLKVGGNLTGSVTADSIGSATVGGTLSGSTITLTHAFARGARALGSLKVVGAASDSTVVAQANLGSIAAGSLDGVNVFAGLANSALPSTLDQFSNQATISAVTSKSTSADVDIAAFSLGKLSLGSVQTNNGGTPFGLAAGTIASVTGSLPSGGALRLKKLDTPDDLQAQLGGADLGDAAINLV